jgi:phosphoribosylformylglycinamidine (FGAM) synthase-like amidotransferase family enzyme
MGESLAYLAQNHYNTFSCHKTTVPVETEDTTIMATTEKSLDCAGFLTLVAQETGRIPKGFEPSYDIVFESSSAMVEFYNYEDMWPEE